MLKVLHIWNTAGVASILGKYQAKMFSWKTQVISSKNKDVHRELYYGKGVTGPPLAFYASSLWASLYYDIIHLHDTDILAPLIKKLYGNSKAVIIHYHGSLIRGRWNKRRKYWQHADAILVSTPDLLDGAPHYTIYIPNPVDTEIFRPMPYLKKKKWALYMYSEEPKLASGVKRAVSFSKRHGYKLVLWHRFRKPIPHLLMPWFLNHFELFIDHAWVPAYSKTALEALACGLKVLRWDNRIIVGLPEEHKPENVVRRLAKVYYDILYKKGRG